MKFFSYLFRRDSESNAAFTFSGFDYQERNLTFVKTAFQVLKLKFYACSMKQAFYQFHKQNIARLDNQKVHFYKLSVQCLVVKPACVNAL